MLQKLDDAVRVKDMAAREARASLSTELLRIANRAKLIFIDTIEVACFLSTG